MPPPTKRICKADKEPNDSHQYELLPTFNMEDIYRPVTIEVILEHAEAEGGREIFPILREMLCGYSRFFRATFKGGFAEESKRSVTLEDVRPCVFRGFMTWMFTHTICDDNKQAEPFRMSSGYLIDLWIFGDKYDCREFRNRVLQTLQLKCTLAIRDGQPSFPSANDIQRLYQNTSPHSVLRKYLIDLRIDLKITKERERVMNTTYPVEFVGECLSRAMRCMEARACRVCDSPAECTSESHEHDDGRSGTKSRWCRFHEHRTAEEHRLCQFRLAGLERHYGYLTAFHNGQSENGDDMDW